MIKRQQHVLVCFALCSTPSRSCSEELFHHSTTLAANASASPSVATSPVITSRKPPPVTELEEADVRKGVTGALSVAGAERDERRAGQMVISPKHGTTQSPAHFLPVPTATGTTTAPTTDTSRRKGRALSESDDPQGGTSWLDSNPPATWAPSSNYTTFHELPPCWSRTTSFNFKIKGSAVSIIHFEYFISACDLNLRLPCSYLFNYLKTAWPFCFWMPTRSCYCTHNAWKLWEICIFSHFFAHFFLF